MTEQKEDDRDEQINERFKIEKINCVAIRTIHKHTAEEKEIQKKKKMRNDVFVDAIDRKIRI